MHMQGTAFQGVVPIREGIAKCRAINKQFLRARAVPSLLHVADGRAKLEKHSLLEQKETRGT